MTITRFEDVESWKEARALVNRIYKLSRSDRFEDHDLRRQMRKAAVSGMANIAEGFDSGTDPEFKRFLRIAKRSMTELQSHLYVALDQEFISPKDFGELYERAARVKCLIGGFVRYLSNDPVKPRTV